MAATRKKSQVKQDNELVKLREELAGMRRRIAEAEAFSRLGSRLATSVSIDDIITVVKEETERLLDWDAFYFAVRRPGSETFRFMILIDTVDGEKKTFPRDEEPSVKLTKVFWDVVNERRPEILNRQPENREEPKLVRFGVDRPSASLLYVPVVSNNETIGVISVQSYSYNRYGEAECALLDQIANTIAPALARRHIEERLEEGVEREDDYFVDDAKQEFQKLLQSIKQSSRFSDENKQRFSIILQAMRNGKPATRQEIETQLDEHQLKLPKNPSGFIRHRLHNIAARHGFVVTSDGNAYRLEYQPRARAIVFFTTEAGDAEHLVNILRAIDRSDRDEMDKRGIRFLEAGGITGGGGDVYCIIDAESPNRILYESIEILQNSKRTSYSMSKKRYLTASEIIQRSETRLVVPGMCWRRREDSLHADNA